MHRLLIAFFATSLIAGAGSAMAQDSAGGAEPAAQPAPGDSAAETKTDPAAAAEPAAAAAPAASSCEGMIAKADLQPACEAALRDDADWRAALGRELGNRIMEYLTPRKEGEPERAKPETWVIAQAERLANRIHQTELDTIRTNNRHVVMAYAALWVLMLGFVAFMWTKQRSLREEIAELQDELREATRDDE